MSGDEKLGISGHLTKVFINSPLTPLFLAASLALGIIALIMVPREEEPQISVPLVDVYVQADGLKTADVIELVTKPLEEILKGIDGVEHTYAMTSDDQALVAARFEVGSDKDDAILRVHERIRANYDRMPMGIPEPLVVGRGINDVPIMVLTLYPDRAAADKWQWNNLYDVAEELLNRLSTVEDIGLTFITGGLRDEIRVTPDPEKLALYGVSFKQLYEKIENANRSFPVGSLRAADQEIPVHAGRTFQDVQDISQLILTTYDGRPVYVGDVANVVLGGKHPDTHVWHYTKDENGRMFRVPAVNIAIAKREGANAVFIAEDLLEKLDNLKKHLLPAGVNVDVTRNYGETANEKANELLFHLASATVVIVLLIGLFIGWREAAVVFVVIPTTILLTLFAAYFMGYTINRVSLFALIFSIGILVDDAIVVVENIDRHWAMKDGRSRVQAAIEAVAEVGNPTIIATLAVIAALLPMLFVSGLMGPYMSPIPVNASAAMLFSFFVAVIITPWLMERIAGLFGKHESGDDDGAEHNHGGAIGKVFIAMARPLLNGGRARSFGFLAVSGLVIVACCVLIYTKDVTVKLLPFDNKSEMQVVLDLPEGSTLARTDRTLDDAVRRLSDLPELQSIQAYAGTSAPFNFNGLVRHYYTRRAPELGDLQINLTHKSMRDRASHAIALDVRERLRAMNLPEGTALQVVEVPPGPPVISTLLLEVYGPDTETRRKAAAELKQIFEDVPYIVDVNTSEGQQTERLNFVLKHENLEFYGVEQEAVHDTIQALLGGLPVGYSHRGEGRNPVEINIRLDRSDRYPSERILATPVPGARGNVELGEMVSLEREKTSFADFRHNAQSSIMVMAELAGDFEAPIYGMLEVMDRAETAFAGRTDAPEFRLHGQPDDISKVSLLWDGEWEITLVTFRDMGMAFGVALLGIYLLMVGQFGNFKIPLVILAPIPFSLIGILLGHWMLSAAFTATSMIGFIALAGIIVRNAVLLVDFIRHRQDEHTPLRQVLMEAGAIRFRPILLTAVTAIIGAAFILTDPIFQGLAISMCFGLLTSTIMTVLVIPAIYIFMRDDGKALTPPPQETPA